MGCKYNISREIFSCPGIVIIGRIRYKDLWGFAGFPTLQYRCVIIKERNRIALWNRIPKHMYRDIVETICKSIALGHDITTNDLYKFIKTLLYLGGYIVTLKINNEYVPLTLFIMDDSLSYALITNTGRPERVYELDEAVMLGYIFQEGLIDPKYCRLVGARIINKCMILDIINGHKLIICRNREHLINTVKALDGVKEVIEFKPDNNPMRHIIVLSK